MVDRGRVSVGWALVCIFNTPVLSSLVLELWATNALRLFCVKDRANFWICEHRFALWSETGIASMEISNSETTFFGWKDMPVVFI